MKTIIVLLLALALVAGCKAQKYSGKYQRPPHGKN